MSADVVTEARALLEKITPGAWHVDRNWYGKVECDYGLSMLRLSDDSTLDDPTYRRLCHVHGAGNGNPTEADFGFIAASPRLVRGLLAEVDRLRSLEKALLPVTRENRSLEKRIVELQRAMNVGVGPDRP